MTSQPTPQLLVDQLTALLAVAPLGNDLFEGARTPAGSETGAGRVFGGQVIAQALAAAVETVPEDRLPNSLHAYFLRMGDDQRPIRYAVARDLDGGSFANRRVLARQEDRLLLSLSASFHRLEQSVEHQDAMPDAPPPESLPSSFERQQDKLHLYPEHRRKAMGMPRPIEQRPVDEIDLLDPVPGPPRMRTWIRAAAPVGDDPRLHRAMLAYASDFSLLPTATRPHGLSWFRGELQEASLDHAMWFHDEFRIDEWLLYETHSSWAGRARGHINGRIFRRDGRLVASVTQEGLMRQVKR